MDENTLVQVIISLVAGILGGAAVVAFRLGKYSEKVDQIEKCDFQRRVSTLEGKIESSQPLKQRKSPVSLTERGEQVLYDSTGKFFVEENYPELKKNVEDKNPQNPYDIQEVSHKVAMGLKNDKRISSIKYYAFKEGLVLDDILDIMGIFLRDKILAERGIAVEVIDVHKPKI